MFKSIFGVVIFYIIISIIVILMQNIINCINDIIISYTEKYKREDYNKIRDIVRDVVTYDIDFLMKDFNLYKRDCFHENDKINNKIIKENKINNIIEETNDKVIEEKNDKVIEEKNDKNY